DVPAVVIRFVCPAVSHVRGDELALAPQDLVDPREREILRVEQVPDVLLDGPSLAVVARVGGSIPAANELLDARGGPAHPLYQLRELGRRVVERERPLGPGPLRHIRLHESSVPRRSGGAGPTAGYGRTGWESRLAARELSPSRQVRRG